MKKLDTTRGQVLSELCPSRLVLSHITSRWAVLTLYALHDETLRFAQIRRTIGGISEKMLTETLKKLEADGFVHRKAYPVVPPKVEYRLTPLGKELSLHIFSLITWLEDNTSKIVTMRTKLEETPS